VATIPVGRDPGSVAVDPNNNRIYVVNRLDNSISVIDGLTNTEIDTDNDAGNGVTRLSFGGAWAVAVNPTTNRIYATGGSITLRVIDGASYSTVADVSIVSGLAPGSLAVNPATNRIYVTTGNGAIVVVDGLSDQVIANVAVGGGTYGGLAVDPIRNRAYRGSGSNVFVMDGATNTPIDTDGSPANGITPITVPVLSDIGGIAVNQDINRLYVALGQNGNIAVIDGSTYTVSQILSSGGNPVDVAVDKANEKIYIARKSGNQVVAVEASTNTSVGGMVTGATPQAVAANEGSNRVYVANAGSTTLSVLNGTYLNHLPLQSSGFRRIDGTGPVDVHVRPGDYEDMRVFVKMPFAVPDGCADASWNVSLVWTVRIHAS